MIIIDFSQVAISTLHQFSSDLKRGRSNPEAVNIIRHAILSAVKSYKKKYHAEYGEVVLACDSKNYWRKDIFPHYKASRSKTRDSSDLDWPLIFETISLVRDEIRDNFPYKVIQVERVEADDIIATLCKWTQTNGVIDRGMFEEKQPVMIVSSDGDFKQLHKYDNVKQFSPIHKKQITCDNPKEYLAAHIAKAGDDGIPNVLSDSDVFITEGTRQKKMTAGKLEQFVELGRDACTDDDQRSKWDRNNQLINLDLIPQQYVDEILATYTNSKPLGDKMKIMNYLIKNRCRLLLDDIEDF